jgi:hypothetical protein
MRENTRHSVPIRNTAQIAWEECNLVERVPGKVSQTVQRHDFAIGCVRSLAQTSASTVRVLLDENLPEHEVVTVAFAGFDYDRAKAISST